MAPAPGDEPARADALDREARARADEVLVNRALAGDVRAVEEIYERYRSSVYKVAFGMTRNVEDALDIVQETFVKAHRSLARFERRASIGTWLCQIALHLGIDQSRRRKVRDPERLPERVSPRPMPGSDPQTQAQELELQAALTRALDQLSEKHRTVFVLYTVNGLSYKEIAESVGISIGTVMSRLFYARKNLQALLAEFAR